MVWTNWTNDTGTKRMALRDLFVLRAGTGVFTAPQTLAAFVLGTCIVVTLSRAARTLAGVDSESTLVTLAAAALVSAGILAVTFSDHDARPATRARWVSSLLVATLNCLLLYVAAIGIEKF
jgi:hypothetical protein